jgi:hypothetical protein
MKRGCIIALVVAAAVPVVFCVALIVGSRVVSGQVESAYGKRMQMIVAAQLQASGPNPEKIVLSETQLDSAFWHMPKVLGFQPNDLEFTLSSARIDVMGSGPFGSPLSYAYTPTVQDGKVHLKPAHLPHGHNSLAIVDPSRGGLGLALEAGINRALEEAGYRATAVDATLMILTIDIEPVA